MTLNAWVEAEAEAEVDVEGILEVAVGRLACRVAEEAVR
jgi:hypothetical protein